MKAIAYIRVSGRGQIDGDGFERQRQAIQEWADREGADVVEWYREEGVTGTLVDRPALARLLVDLEDNHTDVDYVVVEKVDRLARDLYVQETIIRDVAKLDRAVVSATEGDLSGDPTRKLVRQIMGAIAEYDKTMTVQKLAAARARKRERDGRCEGRKPFGHYDGEEETISRIKELRRKPRGSRRRGYATIARILNEEGYETRTGAKWYGTTVSNIVKREFPSMA